MFAIDALNFLLVVLLVIIACVIMIFVLMKERTESYNSGRLRNHPLHADPIVVEFDSDTNDMIVRFDALKQYYILRPNVELFTGQKVTRSYGSALFNQDGVSHVLQRNGNDSGIGMGPYTPDNQTKFIASGTPSADATYSVNFNIQDNAIYNGQVICLYGYGGPDNQYVGLGGTISSDDGWQLPKFDPALGSVDPNKKSGTLSKDSFWVIRFQPSSGDPNGPLMFEKQEDGSLSTQMISLTKYVAPPDAPKNALDIDDLNEHIVYSELDKLQTEFPNMFNLRLKPIN